MVSDRERHGRATPCDPAEAVLQVGGYAVGGGLPSELRSGVLRGDDLVEGHGVGEWSPSLSGAVERGSAESSAWLLFDADVGPGGGDGVEEVADTILDPTQSRRHCVHQDQNRSE